VSVAPSVMRFRVLDLYQFTDEGIFDYYINGHADFMKGQP